MKNDSLTTTFEEAEASKKRLFSAFDSLDADIHTLLTRYKKLQSDYQNLAKWMVNLLEQDGRVAELRHLDATSLGF